MRRSDIDRQRFGPSLARNWGAVAFRGLLTILFGILILVWPEISLLLLVTFFGIFALIGGILALFIAFRGRQADEGWALFLALEGLAGIAAGVIAFLWPRITAVALLYLIAVWAIVRGIFEIIFAIQLRREIQNEWLLGLAGLLSIAFGVLLAIWPGPGLLVILWTIGVYAIILGVLQLFLAFRLRNWHHQQRSQP
jgi:uncharacterized membrane protein HdeD (DUF308 family)